MDHCHVERRAPRRAFTLIELLVVVAILALLMSILLPALGEARQQAKAAVCESNLRSLGIAVYMYAEQNRGWLPEWGFAHGGGEARAALAWLNTMAPEYGENRNILRCPSDRSPHWTVPRTPTSPLRRTSFAANFYVVCGGEDNPLYPRDRQAYNRLDVILRPSATIFLAELAETGEYAESDHVHADWWEWYYPAERREAAKHVMIERHRGQADYALLDGHAERLPFEKTFQINPAVQHPDGTFEWFHNKYEPTIAR